MYNYTHESLKLCFLFMTIQGNTSSQRLNHLSSFQLKILKHAMTFPSVKKVVYSTCSVHKEVCYVNILRK